MRESVAKKSSQNPHTIKAKQKKKAVANLAPPWAPGQSGNPAGRPAGAKNISTYLREFLEVEIEIDADPIIKKKFASVAQAIASSMIKKCLSGDNQMIMQVLDRLEGKPRETIRVDDSEIPDWLLRQAPKPVQDEEIQI